MKKRTVNNIKDIRLLIDGLVSLLEASPDLTTKLSSELLMNLQYSKGWLCQLIEDKETSKLLVIDAMLTSFPGREYDLKSSFIMVNDEVIIGPGNEPGMNYFTDLNTVQKVEWLEKQIRILLKRFMSLPPAETIIQRKCVDNVYTRLTEAGIVARVILANLK